MTKSRGRGSILCSLAAVSAFGLSYAVQADGPNPGDPRNITVMTMDSQGNMIGNGVVAMRGNEGVTKLTAYKPGAFKFENDSAKVSLTVGLAGGKSHQVDYIAENRNAMIGLYFTQDGRVLVREIEAPQQNDLAAVGPGLSVAQNLCADAAEVFDGDTPFSTVGATTDGAPLDGFCDFGDFGDENASQDIWATYTATCTGDLTVSTCFQADYDTRIAVYDGTACGDAPGSVIDCNDDCETTGFTSELVVPVTSGNSYLIRIGGFDDTSFGTGTLTLDCVAPEPVPTGEDECADAALSSISGCGQFPFDNSSATGDFPLNDPECTQFTTPGFNFDVWFLWTADGEIIDGETVTLNTCDQTTVDTNIAVYDATFDCVSEDAPPLITCNDDTCGFQSELSWEVEFGAQYFIRVGTFPLAASGGTGTFTIGGEACPQPAECELTNCQNESLTNAFTSDLNPNAGFRVADDFQPSADGSIESVCWFGVYIDFAAGIVDCSPGPGDDFTITYYNDGGGVPGATIIGGPFNVPGNQTPTGDNLGGVAPTFGYTATHDPVDVDADTCYWIEIVNNTGGGNCFWVWSTSPDGNLAGAQDDGTGYAPVAEDLAFCLDIDYGVCEVPPVCPGSGSCFEANGTVGCDDEKCCNTVCALDPFCCDTSWDATCAGIAADVCTLPASACCFSDGSCSEDFNDVDCAANGGLFQGIGVSCADVVCPLPPDNDDCENAIAVSFDPDFGTALVAGTTVGAFPDAEAFDCGTTITAPGVWYTVMGTGSPIVASTCDVSLFPGSADYDSKLNIYCGSCDELSCVAGNDDGPGCGVSSEVNWCSQFGATYYVYVQGFNGASGNFELALWDTGLPGCEVSVACLPTGACCLGPDCVDGLTQIDCEGQGGVYQGDDIGCFTFGEGLVFASFPGAPISDTLPPTVDTVNIASSGTIGDVDVNLNITHTWIADLTITLEHAGVTVTLWDDTCLDADDIFATANDDAGDPNCGPTTGEYAPLNAGGSPLSAFAGLDWNGDWTLTVTDNAMEDDGTLEDWAVVIFSTGEPNPDVNCCDDAPTIDCFADVLGGGGGGGGDDDDGGGDDDDDDGGGNMVQPNLSVGWDAESPCGLMLTSSGIIDIGCDVIPVDNGQLVRLRCVSSGGGDDDDDDGGNTCGSMMVGDVLVIMSDTAVFIATAEDANGSDSCEIDLCDLIGGGTGGDDDDGDSVTGAPTRDRDGRESNRTRDYTNMSRGR